MPFFYYVMIEFKILLVDCSIYSLRVLETRQQVETNRERHSEIETKFFKVLQFLAHVPSFIT